jgi:DNA-binding CsgD family transcriptional regulator/tetratricopeptide (TPR) repeat protein
VDPTFMPIAAMATLALADRPESLDAWDELLAEAHRHGSVFVIAGYHLWRGWAVAQRGVLGEAEDLLRQAAQGIVELWRTDLSGSTPFAAGLLARILVDRGELAAARSLLEHPGDLRDGSMGGQLVRRAQLELLLADGRAEEALAAADRLTASLREATNPSWSPWRSLRAQALAALGRRDEAIVLVDVELAAARRWGAPQAIGRALRVLGELERERGLDRLEQAVALLDPSTARLELARALVAHGRALRLARRPTEARGPLRRGYEIATVCGAAPLAEHARSELAAAGSRPRAEALSGVGALTPSEQRVASLAAGGSSNREIAQTLYVTPKTVEVHLSATYRKLGIRSRRELEHALVSVP